jgi:hypothetical protein
MEIMSGYEDTPVALKPYQVESPAAIHRNQQVTSTTPTPTVKNQWSIVVGIAPALPHRIICTSSNIQVKVYSIAGKNGTSLPIITLLIISRLLASNVVEMTG